MSHHWFCILVVVFKGLMWKHSSSCWSLLPPSDTKNVRQRRMKLMETSSCLRVSFIVYLCVPSKVWMVEWFQNRQPEKMSFYIAKNTNKIQTSFMMYCIMKKHGKKSVINTWLHLTSEWDASSSKICTV